MHYYHININICCDRSKSRNKPEQTAKDRIKEEIKDAVKEPSISPTNSSNESCLVYVDINFKDAVSDSKED